MLTPVGFARGHNKGKLPDRQYLKPERIRA
jgi:hypothetical protein